MDKELIYSKAYFPLASLEGCGEVVRFKLLGVTVYERVGTVKRYLQVITITALKS